MALNCFKNDILSLEKIINNLWNPNSIDDKSSLFHTYRLMMNKCEEIVYNLKISHWLSDFMGMNIENQFLKNK